MDSSRLNSFVFKWSNQIKYKTKNWCFRIDKELLSVSNTSHSVGSSYTKSESSDIVSVVQSKLFDIYKTKWLNIISSDSGVSWTQNENKVRKYKLCKINYETEPYVKTPILSRGQRSALAKFNCGMAPMKIEIGRYSQTTICERICFNCTKLVEDEIHVLILCRVYQNIRGTLFEKAASLNKDFSSFEDTESLSI